MLQSMPLLLLLLSLCGQRGSMLCMSYKGRERWDGMGVCVCVCKKALVILYKYPLVRSEPFVSRMGLLVGERERKEEGEEGGTAIDMQRGRRLERERGD